MGKIRYTKDHEWVRADGAEAEFGISDFAQEQLGDIVYIELPELGAALATGEQIAVVESVKAASEVYAPVGGTVVGVNEALEDEPGLVNQDATGAGWFVKLELSDPSELDALMGADAYAKFIEDQG